MDPYKTPGAISWNELATTDPEAAGRFYGALFGWSIKHVDMGTGAYHVASVGETQVGGIMSLPPDAGPMPPSSGAATSRCSASRTRWRSARPLAARRWCRRWMCLASAAWPCCRIRRVPCSA